MGRFAFSKEFSKNAKMPVTVTIGAVGYELSSTEAVLITGRRRAVVPTGLAIAILAGAYAFIAQPSGFAVKPSIDVGAGVVHTDYRDKLGVVLINNSDDEFHVEQGDQSWRRSVHLQWRR